MSPTKIKEARCVSGVDANRGQISERKGLYIL